MRRRVCFVGLGVLFFLVLVLLIFFSSTFHRHKLVAKTEDTDDTEPDFFDYFEYLKGRNRTFLRAGAPFVKKSFVGPPVHWTKVVQKLNYLHKQRQSFAFSTSSLHTLLSLGLKARHPALPNFDFVFTQNVPEYAKPAFEFAGELVSLFFDDFQVPVKVKVDWSHLGSGVLAEAGPCSFHRIQMPPEYQSKFPDVTDAWAPRALAKQLKPHFFDAWGNDMVITINKDFKFYAGFDGDVPKNHFDLVSIIMHEIQHGLGFMSLLRKDFRMGNFFYDIEFFWKSKRNHYFIYDLFLHDGEGRIVDNKPNASNQLPTQKTDIIWNSFTFTEDAKPKIYAPLVWEEGSSLSHIDENQYPAGSPSSLMTPRTAEQEAVHHLGDVVVGMFADMGYKMMNCSAITDQAKCLLKFCHWCTAEGTEGRCYAASESKEEGLECDATFSHRPGADSSSHALHPFGWGKYLTFFILSILSLYNLPLLYK